MELFKKYYQKFLKLDYKRKREQGRLLSGSSADGTVISLGSKKETESYSTDKEG